MKSRDTLQVPRSTGPWSPSRSPWCLPGSGRGCTACAGPWQRRRARWREAACCTHIDTHECQMLLTARALAEAHPGTIHSSCTHSSSARALYRASFCLRRPHAAAVFCELGCERTPVAKHKAQQHNLRRAGGEGRRRRDNGGKEGGAKDCHCCADAEFNASGKEGNKL